MADIRFLKQNKIWQTGYGCKVLIGERGKVLCCSENRSPNAGLRNKASNERWVVLGIIVSETVPCGWRPKGSKCARNSVITCLIRSNNFNLRWSSEVST